MKRKVKRYDVGGMTDEEGKKGIFGGPKSSMQDEDTRFKGQASNRRSGLPSFKESTGTSYGSGSDSDSKPKAKPAAKRKLPSNPSAKEFTGEVVKASELGSQSFAAPAAKKESSYGMPAALLAAAAGLGAASLKGNMKRSTDGRSSLPRGIKTLDSSQPDYLDQARFADEGNPNYKRGGKVKKMASGGKSASARADGCAIRGKTRA
jgi:hypothetical protein